MQAASASPITGTHSRSAFNPYLSLVWAVVYMVVTVANLVVGLLGAALTDLHCPRQSSIR